jgi:TRAP-type C4-dicarboxylate transport system permease small subunit
VVLAVIIALLYLLYGGIKWITSRGEKAEVEAARNHIMAAILGLIVVFLAIFLVTVILAAFGIKLDQLQIPTITGTSN